LLADEPFRGFLDSLCMDNAGEEKGWKGGETNIVGVLLSVFCP
jgi:hypothetical protein